MSNANIKTDAENKKIMAENILYYLNAMGKTQTDMCDDLNLKPTTVNGWVMAKKYPRMPKIELMANYFGILKSDLVEEHIRHNPPHYRGTLEGIIGRDAELLEMIQKYLKLDAQKKKAVKQMIDNLSE